MPRCSFDLLAGMILRALAALILLAAAVIALPAWTAQAGTGEVRITWTGTTTNANYPSLPGEDASATVVFQHPVPATTLQAQDLLGLTITVQTPRTVVTGTGSTFVYGLADLTQFQVVFDGAGMPVSLLIETAARSESQGDIAPVALRVRCDLPPGQAAGGLVLESFDPGGGLPTWMAEFQGPFTPTIDGLGACCNPGRGSCTLTRLSGCDAALGLEFRGEGVACEATACAVTCAPNVESLPLAFAAPYVPAATAGERILSVTVGDVSRDGLPDVVAFRDTGIEFDIVCFLGTADGQLGPAIAVPMTTPGGDLIILSDFNLDGKADLACLVADGVAINHGNGDGTFSPPVLVYQGLVSRLLTTGRFNADLWPDIAIQLVSGTDPQSPRLLLNPAAGNVWTTAIVDLPAMTFGLMDIRGAFAADFNADGFDDLFLGRQDGFNTLVTSQNDALNVSGVAALRPMIGNVRPQGVSFTDFNADGYPDTAIASLNVSGVVVQLSSAVPAGVLSTAQVLDITQAIAPACADFNGDNRPDVATIIGTGDGQVGTLQAQRGRGDGTFRPIESFQGVQTLSLAVGDMNADGRPDIVAATALGIVIIPNTTGSAGVVLHPQSQAVSPGGAATFITQGSGSGPISYQWRFNGEPIVGANRPTLTITQATAARAGVYDCVITGAVPPTRAITRGATLTVGTIGSACPADFNNSGGLSVQDIFDFLAAYFAGCP